MIQTTTTATQANDTATWPAERLEAEILELAHRLSADTYELLTLVGELDVRGTWARWGALSCAAWLAEACDIDASTARTQVRVARAMRRYTELDRAMAVGDVSYAKARVLVPHLCGEHVASLVELATRTPAGQLGAAIAAWSMGHEGPGEIERRQHAARSVTWRTDPDGMVVTTIRQPPASAGAFHAAIDHYVRAARRATPGAAANAPEELPTLRQQRADALMELIASGGGQVSTEVVIHVRGADPARFADGTPINDHALASLLPDAFISLLLHDTDDRPIDASPRRRHPTRRQRRVVDERHPHCNHPGCTATAFLQYDHIEPHALGGPTMIRNLQRLCGPHNRAKERAR